MASGHLYIEFNEESSWEGFPDFVERMLLIIGGIVSAKVDSFDTRVWSVEHDKSELRFVFEDYPVQISLESNSMQGDAALLRIIEMINGPAISSS